MTSTTAHYSDASTSIVGRTLPPDSALEILNIAPAADADEPTKSRRAAIGDSPAILTEIYEDDVNIVIWRRQLDTDLRAAVTSLLQHPHPLRTTLSLTAETALVEMKQTLNSAPGSENALAEDCAGLVDMFAVLFDLQQVGLRLTTLDKAMCPKFHVDRVPCRLITTYQGQGTEWVPHKNVDRSKVGAVRLREPDDQHPEFLTRNDVQQLQPGDIALLKGELWEGNEEAGLVHRSPAVVAGEKRLIMTLDFHFND